jgi:cytochrome c oxidase subunit 2
LIKIQKGFEVLGKGLYAYFFHGLAYLVSLLQLSLRAKRSNPGVKGEIYHKAPGLPRRFAPRNDDARNYFNIQIGLMKIITLVVLLISPSFASVPKPWQMSFQPAASPMMEGITHMHNLLLVVITGIAFLVIFLMGYVVIRYRAARNPIPSTTSHNTLLEVVWTLIPVLILVVIAVPSLKLLFSLDKAHNATMTVKAIGHQWYWSYEYPEAHINYDSYMIEEKDLKAGQIRLLSVDNPIIVPVDTTVRILVTSQDVLHSFAVPSLGIKKDAVPGRLNETWMRISKVGDYYGQCSELCGVKHGFMPIHVKVVSQEEYDAWAKEKGTKTPEAKHPEIKTPEAKTTETKASAATAKESDKDQKK